jgi:hypothetical protein
VRPLLPAGWAGVGLESAAAADDGGLGSSSSAANNRAVRDQQPESGLPVGKIG